MALSTAGVAAAASAGKVTDGIRLGAEAKAAKVTSGQSVVVKGTLTNERAGKIALGATDPLGGFRIVIVDAKGHAVRMNASGRDLLKLVHRSKQQLAPGEKMEQSLWLSSLYDLKKPGKYTITMTHDVAASYGIGTETVKSNTVAVWVVKGR
jgi:hypothetical protein